MRLNQVINQYHHPIFETAVNSKIWEKEADTISNMDLLMLYTLLKIGRGSEKAQQGIDLVFDKLQHAYQSYQIDALLCTKKTITRPTITSDEIVKFMEQMTVWQRRAFLFSLNAGMTPTQTSRLEWRDVSKLKLPDSAIDVLEAQVRHIRIKNVFYDVDTQEILAGLEAEFYHVTKIHWATLQEMYDNVLFVDHSEALEHIASF